MALFYVVVLDNNDEVVYLTGNYPANQAEELAKQFNALLDGLGLALNDNNSNDYLAVFHPTPTE